MGWVAMIERHATQPARLQRRVLIFTTRFLPGYKAGGPIKSLVEVLDRLPDSVSATVVTADRDVGDTQPYPGLSGALKQEGRHRVFYFNWRSLRQWLRCARAIRHNSYDLLYLNSFWSPVFTVVPVVTSGIHLLRTERVLLAPRGELSAGALNIKPLKKRLFLSVWLPVLRAADPLFHVSSEMEERDLHRVLPRARTVVQINTRGDEPRHTIVPGAARARFVFVGRIAPMKNVRLALEALLNVRADADFDIFGPLESPRYWESCLRTIDALPPNVRVEYRGALAPGAVNDTFANYDAFIFPTLGENFGHVIAESLAAGCPVLCSPETPWSEVLRGGGGTVLPLGDLGIWTAELERRATQTATERNEAKRTALAAYTAWRGRQNSRLAVEIALDGLPPKDEPTLPI